MSIFSSLKDRTNTFISNCISKAIYSGYSNTSIHALLPTASRTRYEVNTLKLADSYKKFVYRCVNINASTLASTKWKLLSMSPKNVEKIFPCKSVKKSKFAHDQVLNTNIRFKLHDDVDEVYAHPFLNLLECPNPNDTIYDFFFKIVTNMEMFGTSYVLLTRDGDTTDSNQHVTPGGQIIQMDVLHSQYITPRVNLLNYTVEGYWYNYNASTIWFNADQIVRLQYYNLYNDVNGFAPLQAILTQEQLDNLFDEFSLALLENGGVPGSIIKYTGKSLKEEEKDKLETQWNKYLRGGQNNGKVKVIGNDFEVVKLGSDPKDMDFIDGRRVTKEAILNAFGVPMSFVDPKDTNRSSLDSSIYIYQKYTVLPRIKQICDLLNKKLLVQYNEPSLYLSFDNPVEADKTDHENRIYMMLDKGIITPEEARLKMEEG